MNLLSPTSSLASVVLALRCQRSDSQARSLGHAAKALFLRAIASQDQALAEAVEGGTGDRAYTVSSLYTQDPQRLKLAAHYLAGKHYYLRFTALDLELVQSLNGAITYGPLAPGETINLDGIPFQIEAVNAHPHGHPLADQTDYASLARPWSSGDNTPLFPTTMNFFRPTTFKKPGDLYVPVPYPELVFGSLLKRWNVFAPLQLPQSWRQAFAEQVVFSRYELCSSVMPFKSGSKKIGALGLVTYQAPRAGPELLCALNLLADFALYSGAGLMTAMGLGQVRRL